MIDKIPYSITLFGMFLGVLIAIVFGVNEDVFKNRIQEGLSQNVKIQSISDPDKKAAKLSKEAGKNWRYYQRFHFHSTGIGAMSMGVLLFLLFLEAPMRLKRAASYMVSVGGFLYPFVWLFAAMYGPQMGRHEAKEAFAIFGYMGGIFLLGLGLTIFLSFKHDFKKI